MIIIDATDAIAGRMASKVAKMLLKGEDVVIVNAEKAVVSGKPEVVLDDFRSKVQRGDRYKGPFYPKKPAMIIRRVVRGMLPIRKAKGLAALRKLKVYEGCPEHFKNSTKISKTSHDLNCKFMKLQDVSKHIGG